jgi:hypothetical protein
MADASFMVVQSERLPITTPTMGVFDVVSFFVFIDPDWVASSA